MSREMLVYHELVSKAEVHVLENMWRQDVRHSVCQSRRPLLMNLVMRLPLPVEIWTGIFSMIDSPPSNILDVRFVGQCPRGKLYEVESTPATPQRTSLE